VEGNDDKYNSGSMIVHFHPVNAGLLLFRNRANANTWEEGRSVGEQAGRFLQEYFGVW
jgi:hypothetical protein